MKINIEIPVETQSVISGPLPTPSKAQRNPLTTPAIGFRKYRTCHFSEMTVAEYATGVANSQNWVRNGRAWFTSRYCTLIAESQSATPSAVITANNRNSGRVQSRFHAGVTR